MEEEFLVCPRCQGVKIVGVFDGVGRCSHCGFEVLIPKIKENDYKTLLNEARIYRENHEYDLSLSTYLKLIEKYPDSPEGYEGLLLSLYGIEYVKDYYTNKFFPVCHKIELSPVFENPNYKKLLTLLNKEQQTVIKNRFKEISNLQFAIERKMANEESFDVFISYKSQNGEEKTEDSLIAREIYDALTEEGYKVFFSEKTLEKRLGSEYEPIIFKALQTSKVFLLVGTSKENIDSTWVRNEWSRFIERINTDEKISHSSFIPVFKNMSPYDMPKVNNQFVQGVDASKIGYIYTIVDGVKKIVSPTKTTVMQSFDSVETIFRFEKIRRKQLSQIKKQEWDDLQTNPLRKKEKVFHNLTMFSPYLFILISIALLCYPGTWFISGFLFILYDIMIVLVAGSTFISIKNQIKKYPLKKVFQVVVPIVMIPILVVMYFVTMTTIPISYDGKTAYNFTTWCTYTSDYIYCPSQGGKDVDVIYALTERGAKKFTYEEQGKVFFKPPTKKGDIYLHYSFVKIPENAEVLILENMGAIFSTSAGHKTNIKEIYVYGEKENFAPTINITNNSVDEITVYYDAKEFSPHIMGVENVNYIKI